MRAAVSEWDELPMVLLVDADLRLLRSFERLARVLPIKLRTASTAEEAVALIAREGPPVLLMSSDQLSGLDGLSLLAKVRLEHPEVKVVLSSGSARTPLPDSGIEVLPKPVDASGFTRLIESLQLAVL